MKTRKEVLDIIRSCEQERLERMAFTYHRIVEHLLFSQQKETRNREKARIKIALKHINKWFNEYDE